jgi:NAD(P)-dependent dehydrogenase (short-subunit alcohol dehydrogenase family)
VNRFEGKVALIAGASSGIGRVLALRLARSGARVVLMSRRRERLEALAGEIRAAGGDALACAADAQDPAAAERAVQTCVEHHGRIDLLVLNAGGAPALDMRTMGARDVTATMRSNYDVAVNVLFPTLQHMARQRDGVVLTTNSLAGLLAVPMQGPYCAAKGALRLLIDGCRIEFGPMGIRFVSVYPGFIATEATANDGMPAPFEISEDEAVDHILRALRRERMDTLFPFPTSWLVRLARVLPKRLTIRILRNDVPPLPQPTAPSR